MSAPIFVGLMVCWLAVAAAAFVVTDAIFGQPLLGKWWKRSGRKETLR